MRAGLNAMLIVVSCAYQGSAADADHDSSPSDGALGVLRDLPAPEFRTGAHRSEAEASRRAVVFRLPTILGAQPPQGYAPMRVCVAREGLVALT